MNDYGTDYDDDYETDYADGYATARTHFRAKLAGVLTDLRQGRAEPGYVTALDQIAKAMGLKTTTEVRYTA
jgi:hypothetical protein